MALTLTPAQKTIANDTHRFRVLRCGRKFGKTTLALEEMIGCAIAENDRHICYLAPTRDQAVLILWEKLKRRTAPIIDDKNEQRLELKVKTVKGGTSYIYLHGWENVERLRGRKFDFLACDEVRDMKNWEYAWQSILRPTLMETGGGAMFISTPRGYDHFYALCKVEEKDKDYKSFHFTSYDNPYLDKEEIDKMAEEMDDDEFRQEVLAEFVRFKGLVYQFNNYHIVKQLPSFSPEVILGGIDWGYIYPAALVIIKLIDGVFYVVDEYYETGKTVDEVLEKAAELQAKHNVNRWYADPASPENIAAGKKKYGLYIIPAIAHQKSQSGKSAKLSGISLIKQLLRERRLRVLEQCLNIIREFNSYRYPQDKTGESAEIPIAENDHALDALRYALYSWAPLSAGTTRKLSFKTYGKGYDTIGQFE